MCSAPLVKQKCIVCERAAIDGFTHPKCKGRYSIDRTISLWEYSGVVRKAIIALKYKFAFEIAKEVADHSSKGILHIDSLIRGNDKVLIPIPMHWQRKNWRGFNQVEEIGKLISKEFVFQYSPNVLKRNQKRQVQATLNQEQRAKNIEGVFAVSDNQQLAISDKLTILFDDVYTTGATLKEAGKVLKRNGVKKVWALTIAR